MSSTQQKLVRLYVIEEQELYRELYKSVLTSSGPVELLQVSTNGDVDVMNRTISTLNPDVLLLSTKKLDKNIIDELEKIRLSHPQIGIVLLLMFYNTQDIESLRRLALAGNGGMALFLKQSLDLTEQLYGIITAVNQGQVILDPSLTALLLSNKPESPFLKELTARELEILDLLSKGYTNSAIAEALFIDIKTVEHHINSMYSKLRATADFNHKHPRVNAARLYLEAVGELPISTEEQIELVSPR